MEPNRSDRPAITTDAVEPLASKVGDAFNSLPRWRVYFKAKGFPCLTIPATCDGEARRLALIMGPSGGIRKVERVSREEK